MCYREVGGQKDVLTVLQELDFFCSGDIPEESYREELILMRNTGKEPHEISYEIPKQVIPKFYELVLNLELSLEDGLIEELIRYDWALFLVNLYMDVYYLKDLSKGGIYLPRDINESEVILPLMNAYIILHYKPDGRVIHKHSWLTLEKSTTHILISYTGAGYLIDKEVFDFLKSCGHRLTFLEFYKNISSFAQKPEDFLDWLLSKGFMLFSPTKKKDNG